ncbi:MAG: AAA family ATPase [Xanthomonadales bacterium]|nr:AAA family ATPase [Xanthomonadales bacterium]
MIRNKHPLPEPSALDAGTDARRVRAYSVKTLEDAAGAGSTLMPQDQVVLSIRGLSLQPPCEVDGDLMNVARDEFGGALVTVEMADGQPALQLERLAGMGEVIQKAVEKRIAGKLLAMEADWAVLLDEHLTAHGQKTIDELEEQARTEKVAALRELAESRLSVLIGPAGTGKTTLLSVLSLTSGHRWRRRAVARTDRKGASAMEQSAKDSSLRGQTIAQFLTPDRYDGATGRYHLSERPR